MPKKILFESAVHQYLRAASRLQERVRTVSPAQAERFAGWLNGVQLDHPASGQLRIAWREPAVGEHIIEFKRAKFYTRGDTAVHAQQQAAQGAGDGGTDAVMAANRAFFDEAVRATLSAAPVVDAATLEKIAASAPTSITAAPTFASTPSPAQAHVPNDSATRLATEEAFHDEWAASEADSIINVRQRNEACTAPEMRYLRGALGDIRGKELLDVGCGLGEASVYFALEGARVTATDVSPGMCAATQRLATANGTALETHISNAEDLCLGQRQFDIIYIGNTLHHVDLASTLDRLLPHLRPDGTFISWDPVAYNPLINVYRRMATEVRTPDEHPLRLRDVRAITSRFASAEVRWFWLTTLLIFLWMFLAQHRSPNKERYWKKVIDEAPRWEKIYRPLEALDRALLRWLPFLRPLCWNVAIVGRGPQTSPPTRER